MTVTGFMLAAAAVLAPWLTALLRRHSWSDDTVRVVAVLVAAGCFVAGQAADGALAWPLTSEFLTGLAAAVGLQQVGYSVYHRAAPKAIERVENIGNRPVDPPAGWERV